MDFVFQFLTKNPCKRLGFSNEEDVVKTHPFFRRIDWVKMEAREVQPPIIPKVVMTTCYLYPDSISHHIMSNTIPSFSTIISTEALQGRVKL